MADKYENLGPIYTTTEKFEALKTAGTLEIGREYRITDYVPFEFPECPTTTDGVFTLRATVAGGTVTYSWVSVA